LRKRTLKKIDRQCNRVSRSSDLEVRLLGFVVGRKLRSLNLKHGVSQSWCQKDSARPIERAAFWLHWLLEVIEEEVERRCYR